MAQFRSIALLFLVCLMLSAPTAMASGPDKEVRINAENFEKLSAAEQQHVLAVKDRLETIYNTDRSALSKKERQELRSELKELRKEVKEINKRNAGIYISGTLLVVIVLLILLLR